MPPDYYARLGLTKDATQEEIRWAYHRAARLFHPDVSAKAEATKLFLEVQEAYEVLSDIKQREAYDVEYVEQEPIRLRLCYSHSALLRLDEPQLIYVLLELSPHPIHTHKVRSPALNICLVIDRSTSMRGERMDLVKKSAIDLMRVLGSDSTLSIVAFSDRAEILKSATERFDAETIETRIRLLQPGGGTEIYQGLETALRQIRHSLPQKRLSHILLLTDGRTYGDEQKCLELADMAAREGIGITTLGIGDEWNDVFLENLAARTGGRCIYVSQPIELGRSILEKIRSLGQVYAADVQIDLQAENSVQLRYAFRLSPEPTMLSTIAPALRLGDLPKHSTLQMLFEFYIDPLGKERSHMDLAECHLNAEFPVGELPRFERRLLLSRPVKETRTEDQPPRAILHALERLTLYRMQEEARHELASGDISGATRHLHYLADRLLDADQPALAKTVLLEANRLEQGKTLSLKGEKTIKYGTRALLLPQSTEDVHA